MPAITAETVKAKSFTFSGRQPRKRVAALGVADRDHHLAELGIDDHRADEHREREEQGAQREQRGAGRRRLDVEAEDVLEVGEAVIAAEAEIVAEEGEQQGEGHRLGDDRQVDAR